MSHILRTLLTTVVILPSLIVSAGASDATGKVFFRGGSHIIIPLVGETADTGVTPGSGEGEEEAPPAEEPEEVAGEHAYWRVDVLRASGPTVRIAEMSFNVAGADVTTGGTPLGTSDGGFGLSRPFDKSMNSLYWESTEATPSIGYHFAKPVAIDGFTITTENGGRAPHDMALSYSDDGTSWKQLKRTWKGNGDWGYFTTKTFNVAKDPVVAGAHRFWSVNTTRSVPSMKGTDTLGLLEVQFLAGGADVTTGGIPYPVSGDLNYPPSRAFDKSKSGSNFSGSPWFSTGQTDRISYEFPVARKIDSVAIAPYWEKYSPVDFDVAWSDDGATWTSVKSFKANGYWGEGVAREFSLAADPVVPGAHRYWAVDITRTQKTIGGSTDGPSLLELQFKSAGADVSTGGLVFPFSTDGNYGPFRAFDKSKGGTNFNGSPWYSPTTAGFIGYEFPQAKTIDSITMAPYEWNRAPVDFTVKWSDNGTTWTNAKSFKAVTGWSEGVPKDFSLAADPVVANAHRYWRVNVLKTEVGTNGDANGQNRVCINELNFSSNGTDIPVGLPIAGSSESWNWPADRGMDGNPNTCWAPMPDVKRSWLGMEMSTPAAVDGIVIKSSESWDAPERFDLEYSDDGTAWTTFKSYDSYFWNAKETRTFDLNPPALNQGHRFWGLYIGNTQSNGANKPALRELAFTVAGVDVTTGGTGFSPAVDGSYLPRYAFDKVNGSTAFPWISSAQSGFVYYQFRGPQMIDGVSISTATGPNTPKGIVVRWSDDGATWTDYKSLPDDTTWQDGVFKDFSLTAAQ